jgi:hypothetical protein
MNLRWLFNALGYFFQTILLKAMWTKVQGKGVLAYLKAVEAVRRGVTGSILVLIFLQTMVIGLVGITIATVFLATEDNQSRLWILLGIFTFLFVVPLLAIGYMMSGKVWFRISGAERVLVNFTDPKI